MEALFNSFLKEKQFLNGISLKTIRSYKQAFNAYQRVLSSSECTGFRVAPLKPRPREIQPRTRAE